MKFARLTQSRIRAIWSVISLRIHKRKYFLLHEYFLLCSHVKNIPTLKTMSTNSYCFCIVSLECGLLRTLKRLIISLFKVHKRPKTAVPFETLFLLAKPNGYPTFCGPCSGNGNGSGSGSGGGSSGTGSGSSGSGCGSQYFPYQAVTGKLYCLKPHFLLLATT